MFIYFFISNLFKNLRLVFFRLFHIFFFL